jgi:hypothetical protein
MHMLQGGSIHPIQNHQFSTQVQLFHLGTSKVQNLCGRRKLSIQNQGQADIFDAAFGIVCFVNTPVLDHRSGQGDLANARHIGHGFRPSRLVRRSKIWGQLRHVEPPSVKKPRWEK